MREYLHAVNLRNYTILCSKCYKKQALVNFRQISLYLKDTLYCKRMSIFLINYTSVTLVSLNGYKQRLPFCERGREKTSHLQSRRPSSRKPGASKSFSVILRDKEAPLYYWWITLCRQAKSCETKTKTRVKIRLGQDVLQIGLGRFVPRLSLFHTRGPHPLPVSSHLCIPQKNNSENHALNQANKSLENPVSRISFRAPLVVLCPFPNKSYAVRPSLCS